MKNKIYMEIEKKMNIRSAYNRLTRKQFVDWALKNNYPHFIAILGRREKGFVRAKKGNTFYHFDYEC